MAYLQELLFTVSLQEGRSVMAALGLETHASLAQCAVLRRLFPFRQTRPFAPAHDEPWRLACVERTLGAL